MVPEDSIINGDDNVLKFSSGTTEVSLAQQNWCADCFALDGKTKTPATFIAYGFSFCEECFKKHNKRMQDINHEKYIKSEYGPKH